MFNIILMISNYFHDLATALLASNILAVYFLGKYLDKQNDRRIIVADVFKKLSYVTYGSLAYIILAGIPRAYFFMDFEWNPAIGKGQVTALVIKHIFLFSVTTFGIIAHVKYQKKYGK